MILPVGTVINIHHSNNQTELAIIVEMSRNCVDTHQYSLYHTEEMIYSYIWHATMKVRIDLEYYEIVYLPEQKESND